MEGPGEGAAPGVPPALVWVLGYEGGGVGIPRGELLGEGSDCRVPLSEWKEPLPVGALLTGSRFGGRNRIILGRFFGLGSFGSASYIRILARCTSSWSIADHLSLRNLGIWRVWWTKIQLLFLRNSKDTREAGYRPL